MQGNLIAVAITFFVIGFTIGLFSGFFSNAIIIKKLLKSNSKLHDDYEKENSNLRDIYKLANATRELIEENLLDEVERVVELSEASLSLLGYVNVWTDKIIKITNSFDLDKYRKQIEDRNERKVCQEKKKN